MTELYKSYYYRLIDKYHKEIREELDLLIQQLERIKEKINDYEVSEAKFETERALNNLVKILKDIITLDTLCILDEALNKLKEKYKQDGT